MSKWWECAIRLSKIIPNCFNALNSTWTLLKFQLTNLGPGQNLAPKGRTSAIRNALEVTKPWEMNTVNTQRQSSHPDPTQYSYVIIIQLYIYIYIQLLLLCSLKDNYKKITLPSIVVLMV